MGLGTRTLPQVHLSHCRKTPQQIKCFFMYLLKLLIMKKYKVNLELTKQQLYWISSGLFRIQDEKDEKRDVLELDAKHHLREIAKLKEDSNELFSLASTFQEKIPVQDRPEKIGWQAFPAKPERGFENLYWIVKTDDGVIDQGIINWEESSKAWWCRSANFGKQKATHYINPDNLLKLPNLER